MIDIVNQINAISRQVGTGQDAPKVVLRRRYDAEPADVWDACTNAERIARWFLPVSGDLKVGGKYQLQGNAGGEILRCEPPRLLRLTWVFGDQPASEVEVRLAPDDDGTVLELEHIAAVDPAKMGQYGPGAVGVGWDLTLLGLGLHLSGNTVEDPAAWQVSPEAKDFVTRSSQAWGDAYQTSGASADVAAAAAAQTTAFYTGEAL